MAAIGIIFSDIHEWSVGELAASRAVASIPFAGRYWLIDFVLSNMINSGVHKVGVVTKSNYQPLMEHIGSGKDWDLSRKNGGISILPPYSEDSRVGLYRGRLDALMRISNYIAKSDEEFVIMADCDMICNVDYADVIERHKNTGADITAIYCEENIDAHTAQHSILYQVSPRTGRVEDVFINPNLDGTYKLGMNSWVMRREYMMSMLNNAVLNGKTSFSRDVLYADARRINIMGYKYNGYIAFIDSEKNYFKHNMEMLKKEKRNQLFGQMGRFIYTRVRDSLPAHYGETADVKNSLVADGCHIDGKVSDSVIFRGVKIGKNSDIRNSIIMQDTVIGENVELDWVICDKNAVIHNHKRLLADRDFHMYVTRNVQI